VRVRRTRDSRGLARRPRFRQNSGHAGRAGDAMQLKDVVEMYKGLAGEFGRPVELSQFGLSHEETEKLFSVFDEDYLISRYLHFVNSGDGAYSINDFPYTHVMIDQEIQQILQ